MYRAGQKVECIDDTYTPKQRALAPHRPVRGGVYTIRQALHGYRGLGLRLAELHNPEIRVVCETGSIQSLEPLFLASRFRLLSPSTVTPHEVEHAG